MQAELFNIGVKALIQNSDKRILIIQAKTSSHDFAQLWDLPGGKIHPSESLVDGLKREILEEIGVKQIKIGKLFDTSISKKQVKTPAGFIGLLLITFVCTINTSQKITIDESEHVSIKWTSSKNAAKLLSDKFSDQFVKKLTSNETL